MERSGVSPDGTSFLFVPDDTPRNFGDLKLQAVGWSDCAVDGVGIGENHHKLGFQAYTSTGTLIES